ncbi:anti-sigma factor [Nocardioides dubius]|uniref:Histidine kinase/HSP90-like ATPase domain-containing protein n=1 Tax=Nocardioides dubius TaxID=317019 RepID=A0ABN1TL13_9ACTN
MRPDVELRLPVDPAFVSVLRATAVSLAARLNFTIDDIEDLRMAVSEASALVLPHAQADGDLVAGFHTAPDKVEVRISVPTSGTATPPAAEEDFAWQVLSALTTHAELQTGEGSYAAIFTVHSTATV